MIIYAIDGIRCGDTISSARFGEPDGKETEEWNHFKSNWKAARATQVATNAVLSSINKSATGLSIDFIYSIVSRELPTLTHAYPRCIHEKHEGEGYRSEWEHWIASGMQAMKRKGLVKYDKDRERWMIP